MTQDSSHDMTVGAPVEALEAAAYTIPTDQPESDGTLQWDRTTLVVVHARSNGTTGTGYTYAHGAAAELVADTLAAVVRGRRVADTEAIYDAMVHAVRNVGRQGIAACAISAADIAVWDLKARLLNVPLVALLGGARESVRIYGSGGFTSYSTGQLQRQLAGWVAAGIGAVKMKVGRDPAADLQRVSSARDAIGDQAELFVDANGAYDRKQALAQAERFARSRVSWFEEPVSSDDLDGLRLIRDRAPAGMEIAAGEYGYDPAYFQRMAAAGAIDMLQADATRCGGVTGFMRAAAIADAYGLPMSAHTAPGIHVHLCCAASRVRNLEYFHDHVRIEQMLFDGAVRPAQGTLAPDRSQPGLGLVLRDREAARFA